MEPCQHPLKAHLQQPLQKAPHHLRKVLRHQQRGLRHRQKELHLRHRRKEPRRQRRVHPLKERLQPKVPHPPLLPRRVHPQKEHPLHLQLKVRHQQHQRKEPPRHRQRKERLRPKEPLLLRLQQKAHRPHQPREPYLQPQPQTRHPQPQRKLRPRRPKHPHRNWKRGRGVILSHTLLSLTSNFAEHLTRANGKDTDIYIYIYVYLEAAPRNPTSRLAPFLSSSSLSLPLSPASLPSPPSPSPSSPSPSPSPSPPSLSRLAYSSLMHHENSRVPYGSLKGGKRAKRKGEKCMHEKGSRVTDTICLVVEKRTGSTRSPYFRLISVMRNTNARVIRMPGMKDKRGPVPYSRRCRDC